MRCSSCIGGDQRRHRSLSSGDPESASPAGPATTAAADQSDVRTMAMELAASSGSPGSPDSRPPSVTIEELDDDVFISPSDGGATPDPPEMVPLDDEFTYLLAAPPPAHVPLEVIREEECSGDDDDDDDGGRSPQNENSPTPAPRTKRSPVKVLRDLLLYRRRSGRRKSHPVPQPRAHIERQEPTICMLVGAKECDIATEYRAVCTTDTVDCEQLEAELVNLGSGSNSSSLDDLSDVDDTAATTTSQEDEPEPVPNRRRRSEPADQQQDQEACDDGVPAVQNTHGTAHHREHRREREDAARDDTGESRQPSHSLAVRTDDEKMRAKTHRRLLLLEQRNRADPGLSLSSGAAVDGHRDGHRVVSEAEEDVPQPKLTASGGASSGAVPCRSESESVVNHSEPGQVEQIMSIVDGDTVTTTNDAVVVVVNTSDSRRLAPVESPPPSPPPPPAPKAAIALPPHRSSEVTNRGHPKIEPLLPPPPPLPAGRPAAAPLPLLPLTVEALSTTTASGNGDGQIPGGDHSSQADPADADPSGAQDSVPAVVPVEAVPSADQSVLLKYIHGAEDTAVVGPGTASVPAERKRSSAKKKPSPTQPPDDSAGAASSGKRSKPTVVPRSNGGPGNDDVDRRPKIEHIHGGAAAAAGSGQYQRVNGGGYEATSPPPHLTTVAPGSIGVGEFRAGTMTGPRGELDAPDLRSEVCRAKDAELLAEFRKLEQETARYEQELQKISVGPFAGRQPAEERVLTENRTYVVSKQHDFVVNSEWSTNGTSGRMRNGTSTKIPAPQPSRPDPRGQQPPVAIPGPPADQEEQEYCTKKVKERVQELMASEAARAGGPVVRRNGGTATVSAPSTPTASRRKHIEAEFCQFRELRAQEQQQQQKAAPSAGQLVGPYQVPSKIPLPVVGKGALGATCPPAIVSSVPSGPHDQEQQSGEDAVRVNVAALIATHQEKQQSQAPTLGQLRNRVPSEILVPVTPATVPPSSAPTAADASDEVVVSVSDKCQQFERRIRQNSIGQQGGQDATPKRAPKGTHEQQMSSSTGGNACGADCSEADLLHEIDHALVLAKDFLFTRGVWSPFNRSTEVLTKEELAERSVGKPPSEPLQPVWVPRSAPPSPVSERREFRPIGFESPTPSRRNAGSTPSAPASVAAPWTQPGYTPPAEPTPPPPQQQVRFPPLPRATPGGSAPEPTINSLLKSKDGKTASSVTCTDTSTAAVTSSSSSTVAKSFYQQQQQQQSGATAVRSASSPAIPLPAAERMQPTATSTAVHQPKVDGIGPTTREGMPLTLRSEIDEGNRDKWYKQMYQTLHKAHDDDDYVTVRYKTRKGYPYKSPGGYQSEPEPNYDSDYTIKYSTLDRRRTPIGLSPTSYNKFNTLQPNTGGSQPAGSVQQPPVRARNVAPYRSQPGRIENYTPGRSSISDKESKEWWDEVMDIFNGHQKQLTTSKTYEGNLSRALLKEQQGYESDSTLVFRKRVDQVDAGSALSPVEQKQHYRTMQAGGEIPLHGFRKPAPEKPKESPRRYIESDVNIHYKTPIRFEYKDPIPDDELAYRQAEHMRRVYQEERRRKYINELEDMHSRRHTDNILPSQKSPIPLNRYDDFAADLSPKPQQPPLKTIARALYNFQGQSIRELSFRKGDIIYLRRQVDKNWYEGEHNATVGLLPANYIEILTRDSANVGISKPAALTKRNPVREGKARAKFNFTAQTAVELSLLKGELVTLTRRVDDNWFEGKIGSKKGIFPVSYVEILTDIDGAESYDIEPVVSKPVVHLHHQQGQPAAAQTLTTTHYGTTHSNGRVSPGIVRETKTVQKTEVLHVDTSNEPISYRALYNYKPQNTDELELHEGDIVYVLEKCDDGWYVGTSARTGCFGTFPGNYVNKM
ncbi:uncharacterized protein LOC128278129 [Anopheles cruzii]|uniref:uncharacterized protein LOC128278129 n=1 Tax=Anopheles cruzii TaxID=68878 RepID=UPI0022EC6D08|nr:uncharacterized protein LOC128278129 [Anopheles cruzii]